MSKLRIAPRLLLVALAVLLIGAPLTYSAGLFPQVSAGAEAAKKKYLAALEKAQEKYSTEAEAFFHEHLLALENVLEAETKGGRLDVAVAIRDEIQRLKAEGASVFAEAPPTSLRQAIARLTGTWHVVFPSGAIRVYVVDAKGGVSYPAEKYFTKIKGPPGEMIVDFGEGKLERWSIAGDRLFCEHWDPKTNFGVKGPSTVSVGTRLR
jgi:hypothetical protein